MNGNAHIYCANIRIFRKAEHSGHSKGIYKYIWVYALKKIEQYEWSENRKCILHP